MFLYNIRNYLMKYKMNSPDSLNRRVQENTPDEKKKSIFHREPEQGFGWIEEAGGRKAG
jgi:hypothetical protein